MDFRTCSLIINHLTTLTLCLCWEERVEIIVHSAWGAVLKVKVEEWTRCDVCFILHFPGENITFLIISELEVRTFSLIISHLIAFTLCLCWEWEGWNPCQYCMGRYFEGEDWRLNSMLCLLHSSFSMDEYPFSAYFRVGIPNIFFDS